jgi:adenylate cyclase
VSSLEIERKFLVADDSWRSACVKSERLKQGYLNRESRCSVRVRIAEKQAWLNLKSVTIGAQRYEFDYEIPLQDAELMLQQLSSGPLVEKTRYYLEAGAHTWEIDVFEGANAGLVVAEIELEHPDEPFERPPWLGEEVTYDPRYYNTSLAQTPFKSWPSAAMRNIT